MAAGAIRAPLIIPLRHPVVGKSKNLIDTGTQIDLSSDTPDTRIYFTIDGSRPDPETCKSRGHGRGSTHLFRRTFTLPAGARTVKAIAFLPSTKQESNIVTKTFDVKPVDSGDSVNEEIAEIKDDYGFLEELKAEKRTSRKSDHGDNLNASERRSPLHSNRPKSSTGGLPPPILKNSFTDIEISKKARTRNKNETSKSNSPPLTALDSNIPEETEGKQKRVVMPDEKKQFDRIQKQVDVLNCSTCYAARPADVSAIFCGSCGSALPRLPVQTSPQPRVGLLTECTICGSTSPPNSGFCLVCESPLNQTFPSFNSNGSQPYPSKRRPSDVERRLCATCGSLNPVQMHSCLTCEASLPADTASLVNISSLLQRRPARPTSSFSSILPATDATLSESTPTRFAECRLCRRQNNPNARYCDWCGSKEPCRSWISHAVSSVSNVGISNQEQHLTTSTSGIAQAYPMDPSFPVKSELNPMDSLVCVKCFTTNPKDSCYCARCAAYLPPPPRWPTSYSDAPPDQWSHLAQGAPTISELLLKRSPEPKKRNVCSASTQTVGIFYPSAADLRRTLSEVQMCKDLEKDIRSRANLLAPISPGKGYWRLQLEHILAHLKAYTRNNAGFKGLLGHPRLGKLLSAGFEEDEDELTIFLTFRHHNRPAVNSFRFYNRDEKSESVLRRHGNSTNKNNNCCHRGDNSGFVSDASRNWRRDSGSELGIGDCSTDDNDACTQPHSGSLPRSATKIKPRARERADFRKTETEEKAVRAPGLLQQTSGHDSTLILQTIASERLSKLSEIDKKLLLQLNSGRTGNIEEIMSLLSKGANPRCVEPMGDPALILAVRNHHLEAIPALVQAGADVNAVGARDGNSALHEAVLLDDDTEDFVRVLLRLGADPHAKNAQARSPFELAKYINSKRGLDALSTQLNSSEFNGTENVSAVRD